MSTYTLVEYMPACWRESHRAARNSGVYPQNGAQRAWVAGAVDPTMLDPDWSRIVRTADTLPAGETAVDLPEEA